MPTHPHPLQVLLKSPGLAAIHAQLETQGNLLRAVRQALPEFLAEQCRHCVAKDESLLIYVDSAAWGSQLRFYGPSLLAQLEQTTGRRFRDVRIRNLPPPPDLEPPRRAARPPTRAASDHLRASAGNAASGELRDALLRLSQTLEKSVYGK